MLAVEFIRSRVADYKNKKEKEALKNYEEEASAKMANDLEKALSQDQHESNKVREGRYEDYYSDPSLKKGINKIGEKAEEGGFPGKMRRVKEGDSLWKLAKESLGQGASYREIARLVGKIVDSNKAEYPSLETNPNSIKKNWVLVIPSAGSGGSSSSGKNPGSSGESNSLNLYSAAPPFDSFSSRRICSDDGSCVWMDKNFNFRSDHDLLGGYGFDGINLSSFDSKDLFAPYNANRFGFENPLQAALRRELGLDQLLPASNFGLYDLVDLYDLKDFGVGNPWEYNQNPSSQINDNSRRAEF